MPAIVLKLGMKQAAVAPVIICEDIDMKHSGSDGTVVPDSEPPVTQNTKLSEASETTNPQNQDNDTFSALSDGLSTNTTHHGPPASRLRPRRTPSPNSSRASSRAPTPSRKPRKPTKDSLLNGRRAFQKSRAWQQALVIATEALERHETVEQIVPTERERVLAKRIAGDQEKLTECMAEIWRLRGVVGVLARELEEERVPSSAERS